jgi:hypothetical protein
MGMVNWRSVHDPEVLFIDCVQAKVATSSVDKALIEADGRYIKKYGWTEFPCMRCRDTCHCGIVRRRYLKIIDRLIRYYERERLNQEKAKEDLQDFNELREGFCKYLRDKESQGKSSCQLLYEAETKHPLRGTDYHRQPERRGFVSDRAHEMKYVRFFSKKNGNRLVTDLRDDT